MLKDHKCTAIRAPPQRKNAGSDGWGPVQIGVARPPPAQWHIYTDGSATLKKGIAGWGVAIFRTAAPTPEAGDPEYELYGPAVVEEDASDQEFSDQDTHLESEFVKVLLEGSNS